MLPHLAHPSVRCPRSITALQQVPIMSAPQKSWCAHHLFGGLSCGHAAVLCSAWLHTHLMPLLLARLVACSCPCTQSPSRAKRRLRVRAAVCTFDCATFSHARCCPPCTRNGCRVLHGRCCGVPLGGRVATRGFDSARAREVRAVRCGLLFPRPPS